MKDNIIIKIYKYGIFKKYIIKNMLKYGKIKQFKKLYYFLKLKYLKSRFLNSQITLYFKKYQYKKLIFDISDEISKLKNLGNLFLE